MTFIEHVLELRKRLGILLIAILFTSIIGYIVFPYFFNFIINILSEELYVTKIYEGFLTRIRIALLIGLLLSIPFLIYELIAFILPAFNRKEKIIILILIFSSFILFLCGIYFSLKMVLPISVSFLRSENFFPTNLGRIISYDSFIIFFFQFLVSFGLCLQFPVVILTLLYFKVLKMQKLIRFLKYFVAVSFLIAGILTPPDVVSQSMLALPMILLYLLCILIGKLLHWG